MLYPAQIHGGTECWLKSTGRMQIKEEENRNVQPRLDRRILYLIEQMLQEPTAERIEAFYHSVRTFADWGEDDRSWPSRFMEDSEINWLTGLIPVGDI
ncbi:hypothetical protein SAMN02744124_04266 [Paenibacillus barengoltzii J12]|uniref:Uncharacterized protein n=2 Tax=Paenibacillus barengoltzii TaxID=343517 RepID=R9LJD4_9BACL|nr:hypothetical protein C812_00400 [Paenibacillus barengoltzii G22]SMF66460.1 hypothetical protein SAMN02744124_04266 [Paenibacillus barengoltzii J12]